MFEPLFAAALDSFDWDFDDRKKTTANCSPGSLVQFAGSPSSLILFTGSLGLTLLVYHLLTPTVAGFAQRMRASMDGTKWVCVILGLLYGIPALEIAIGELIVVNKYITGSIIFDLLLVLLCVSKIMILLFWRAMTPVSWLIGRLVFPELYVPF